MSKFTKFGLTKSKMEKYLRCGFAYDCHYNKKIRPIKTGSALMFGIGIDDGLNELLKKTKINPMDAYKAACEKFPLGTVEVSKYDYDKYLLDYKDKESMLKECKKIGYKGKDSVDDLFKSLWDKEKRSEKQEQVLDYLARKSLEKKAEIIFDAYKEQILPKIKKVHSVQKTSETGIIDLVADWETKGNTYVVDNKTASSDYEIDAADYSVQLILYAIEENINKVMFIVIPKRIDVKFTKTCTVCGAVCQSQHRSCAENDAEGKRCGGKFNTVIDKNIEIKVIKAEVTEEMKRRTLEIKAGVQKQIDSKVFICNFANCGNQFGKPCEYRDLYWKGDMTGLKKVEYTKTDFKAAAKKVKNEKD